MAWSASDDAVVAYQSSPEFEEAALAWAKENMVCEMCQYFNGRSCELWVEDTARRSHWGCTLWEART